MSWLPIALLGLLLAGAAILAFAARPLPSTAGAPVASSGRSSALPIVAAAIPLLALLVWLVGRSGADAAAWQLTGIVLWLLVAVLARMLLDRQSSRLPASRIAAAFVLAAVALPALWVADDRARVGAVALFAAVRLALSWRAGRGNATAPVVGSAALVLLLWAAATGGAWPALFALASGAILLGLWPLDDGTGDATPLASGLSAVVGAAVLLPWLRAGALPPVVVAAATAAGLLALLVGPARLRGRSAADMARALAPALGGLALVAGVWAGEPALLPAVRLAVFVPAVLWSLSPVDASGPARGLPRLLPLGLAYLALAGLPLTAGFGALSRLYAAWLPGGWVLVVVAVALLSLWLAVVYQSGRAAPDEAGPVAGSRALWLGALPAALGLVQVDTAAFAQSPLVWAAVVLPALLGAALGHFGPALSEVGALLRESVGATGAIDRLTARLGPPARRVGDGVAAALADAVAILDGQNGLLFLLGLLLLLLWIGR